MSRTQTAAALLLVVVANLIAGLVAVVPLLLLQLSVPKVRPGRSEDWFVPGLFLVSLVWVLVLAGIMNWIAWRSTRLAPIVLVGLVGASLAAPMGFLELVS